mmetsp:Transcript_24008/g.66769  ORF Transcript_24008/g.66769 Transcript_24008/m.66769 type:complete len:255 (+) Transcript_24008:53-817(+)|eukprot:CAMPEP_0117523616 /NCGR_PEP_ID=MMETSP0784-20121206/34820_1 /TAXON_ID=39447 /ORGANISM="" /LENGTH=254 /DNA_ID=CAMNT_0005319735 /DNA_START=41 /DNA_END=805 /DNA_ORIENTATION=-
MVEWKKLLLAAGGAAGACAVLYYLLKDDAEGTKASLDEDEKSKDSKRGATRVEDITKEQVQQILQEIIQSQEQMKGYMKDLTKELLSKQLTFEQTYQRVKEVQPSDPLERCGLSMLDFDKLLNKHQSDPAVRDAIAKIMGAPNPGSVTSDKVQAITTQKILEVHQFMLEEFEKLVNYFQDGSNKSSYDMKTVTIAAQAIIGSKVEAKFGITSEDIESAVLMYHTVLATDKDFAQINCKIQSAMGKLMGTPFPQQ